MKQAVEEKIDYFLWRCFMYKIEKTDFGYKITFEGFIKANEMKDWVLDSMKTLSLSPSRFHLFVDMRNLKALPEDSKKLMKEGQKLYKFKGMERSVVIVDNIIIKFQFKQIAKESGINEWERYIVASAVKDWENAALNWITKEIDPDKFTYAV
jgi:hypothetical protein